MTDINARNLQAAAFRQILLLMDKGCSSEIQCKFLDRQFNLLQSYLEVYGESDIDVLARLHLVLNRIAQAEWLCSEVPLPLAPLSSWTIQVHEVLTAWARRHPAARVDQQVIQELWGSTISFDSWRSWANLLEEFQMQDTISGLLSALKSQVKIILIGGVESRELVHAFYAVRKALDTASYFKSREFFLSQKETIFRDALKLIQSHQTSAPDHMGMYLERSST
jgi:hypothetical protein